MKQIGVYRGVIIFLLVSLTNAVLAQTVVVPNALENTEAPGGNTIPFGTDLFCDNGIRYQQVYADAQIPVTGPITAVRFRLDGGVSSSFSSVYGGTSVSMSTAANGPTDFSEVFAENIGSDVVEVFAGNLSLGATGGSALPQPFDVEIEFQTPFVYSGGDLLFDISIQTCADPGVPFDRPDGSDVSLTRRITATDVNDSSANSGSGVGLVTQFQFENVLFQDRFEGASKSLHQ